jgi:hypothetical protein
VIAAGAFAACFFHAYHFKIALQIALRVLAVDQHALRALYEKP